MTNRYQVALALHQQGKITEAVQAYTEVLTDNPRHGDALHGLGVLYLQAGQTDLAIGWLQRAVDASGGATVVQNNLGVALCSAGRFDEAVAVYRAIISREPQAVSSYLNLGRLLVHLQRFPEAVKILQKATGFAPHPGIHHMLAVALAGGGQWMDAAVHFEKSLSLSPKDSQCLCDYAVMQLQQMRPAEAERLFRMALSISPGLVSAIQGLGEALGAQGAHEPAISCFQQVNSLAPDYAPAYYNCGTALTYLGRTEQAVTAFHRAIACDPKNPDYRSALLALEKPEMHSPHIIAIEKSLAEPGVCERKPELLFALAKAYDDSKNYAGAFDALMRGNKIKRQSRPYTTQSDLDRFHAIMHQFDAGFITSHTGYGSTDETPVFVVGMPRSGTTLVEQVLASHSHVFGAGELGVLPDLINSGVCGDDFPKNVEKITKGEWQNLADAYVSALRKLSPTASRITDKLPLNFQLIGLIHIALPAARIIHVSRDPLDTCFSCYSLLFGDDALNFSYDLTDLGQYYCGYMGMMAHWRNVLPAGVLTEVRYEDLVGNFETEARRLINACGLEWDARCLEFYKTKRAVETASLVQVRMPLYNRSVGRAQNYIRWLEPLRIALENLKRLKK